MIGRFEIAACTATGLVRSRNEDHVLVGRIIKNRGSFALSLDGDDDVISSQGLLFAVADGIGGAPGGAVASRLALQALDAWFYRGNGPAGVGSTLARVEDAIDKANAAVLHYAASKPNLAGMGCTLAGVCLTEDGYAVFSAGDSRVYRLRDGVLRRLTEDDTVAALAVRAGSLTLAEALNSNHQNVLVNFIGADGFRCHVKAGPELRPGDQIMVCTDGLHGLVDHNTMEEFLARKGAGVSEKLDRLLEAALNAGGHDNVSIVLVAANQARDNVANPHPDARSCDYVVEQRNAGSAKPTRAEDQA